jgi:hypothetical protein
MGLEDFDAAAAFTTAFDAELADIPEGTEIRASGRASKAHPRGEDDGWWRSNGPGMVQAWIDWRTRNPGWTTWVSPDGTLGIELELNVSIDGEQIKLFIDNVMSTQDGNGRPIVVDKKSGGMDPYWMFQLGLYKTALETVWPDIQVFGGAYWMARKGELSGIVPLDSFTPKLVGTYARRVREIRARGAYLPSVGSQCKSCGVGKYCAANNGAEAHLDPDFYLLGGN